MKVLKSISILLALMCVILPLKIKAQDHPKNDSLKETSSDSTTFVTIEQLPQFPGGDKKRIKYLYENIKYPIEARKQNIQGQVLVTFVVERDGSISDARVLQGIGGGCDEEAIRLINSMPNWVPGIQRGKPVRVQFNMNVLFKLNGSHLPVEDVNFNKGIKNMEQGYYSTASKSFSKSIKKNGIKINESYINRAICYYKLGQIEDAIKDIEVAGTFNDLKIDRTIATLYLNLGNDANEMKDSKNALIYFNKGLEADSGNTDLLFQRGKLHKQLNQIDEACKDFSRAYNLGHGEAKEELDKVCNN